MIVVNKHFSRNYNEILAQGYRFAKHDANTYYLTIGSQYNSSSYKLNLNKTLEIIYPWANNGRDISHLNPLFEKVRAEHNDSLTHLYEYILRTTRYYVPGQNEVKRELKNIPHFTNYYKELIESYEQVCKEQEYTPQTYHTARTREIIMNHYNTSWLKVAIKESHKALVELHEKHLTTPIVTNPENIDKFAKVHFQVTIPNYSR